LRLLSRAAASGRVIRAGMHADALASFCRRLPKAELHAHLNGCIRPATLQELATSIAPGRFTAEELDDLAFKRRVKPCAHCACVSACRHDVRMCVHF
jgi:hypothetical protein